MYLKSLKLTNFKTYKNVEFKWNDKFNMIIGENNIGKTTIFDALLLWRLAYLKLIKKDKKGFYKKTNYNSMKVNFTNLSIFRIINSSDLFLDPNQSAKIILCVTDDSNDYNLEIELNKPDIENSYVRFMNNKGEFDRFANYCNSHRPRINLDEAINIRLTKPISSILKREIFYNRAYIENKTFLGLSNEVLRNKILLTMENKKFDFLNNKLTTIFSDKYTIRFKNSNRDDSEFINITIQRDDKEEVDLSLVGSGIMHILEIFSTIKSEQNENTINLLLLDEPDTHIHADIQSKLIDVLKVEDHLQTFLITHNDRLMKKASDGELLYISSQSKEEGIIESIALEDYEVIKQELAISLYDAKKPILLVEDEHYQIYQIAWLKLNDIECNKENFEEKFDSEAPFLIKTGKSAGGVAGLLRMKDSTILKDIKVIGLFDFDKEGRENFHHLKNDTFWNESYLGDKRTGYYKARTDDANFFAMLLPIPDRLNDLASLDWDNFVSYVEIENLLPDKFLTENNFAKEKNAPGKLQYLKVKTRVKAKLWKKLFELDKSFFCDFDPLFSKINVLLF